MRFRLAKLFILLPAAWVAASTAYAIDLRETIEATVNTNPAIEAARANARATTYEFSQAQGRALPQLSLEADVGAERIDKPNGLAAQFNDQWQNRRQATVVLRQFVFDGWDRANDVYKNAARVDAASLRVYSRSEALALDAVDAYVDVQRHADVLAIAQKNVARHFQILSSVRQFVRGGKGAQSEVAQVEERLAGAQANVERVRQSHLEAQAKFRRVVGLHPRGLAPVRRPAGVDMSVRAAVEAGLSSHPLLAALQADVDAAHSAMEQTRSARLPQIALEARGIAGVDVGGTPGRDNEVQGRVVLNWQLFDGRITSNKTREFAERRAQAQSERDERVRQITEEIERAIAARLTGGARLNRLRKQADRARAVARAYAEEHKAGKRSLLDLLDSESARFSIEIQVASQNYVQVFTDYRVLGAMGRLLESVGVNTPVEVAADRRDLVRQQGPFSLEPLRR